MKLPGGMDLGSMMRQAQEMQAKMGQEMKQMGGEAAAGGGDGTGKMGGGLEGRGLTDSAGGGKSGGRARKRSPRRGRDQRVR